MRPPVYTSSKPPKFERVWDGLTNVWTGSISQPDIHFAVRQLRDAELPPIRALAGKGQIAAMRILGAHKDKAGVPDLMKALQSDHRGRQEEAAEALSKIATSEAVDAMGKRAVRSGDVTIKWEIALMLGKTGNKAAIPWLKELLKDNHFSESHVTYRDGKPVDKHYKIYDVRRAAKKSLKELGVEDSTPDEVEVSVK